MFASIKCTWLLALMVSFLDVNNVSGNVTELVNSTRFVPPRQNTTLVGKSRVNVTVEDKTLVCEFRLKEFEVSKFIELKEHSQVNIVGLRFIINNQTTISLNWTNNVGREILSYLDLKPIYITTTLNAGRRLMDMTVELSPKGCLWRANKSEDVAQLVDNVSNHLKQPQEELCYELGPKQRRCCKIIHLHGFKKKKTCYTSIPSRFDIDFTSPAIYLPLSILSLNLLYFLVLLLRQFPYDGDYYKLSESPVSFSRLFIKLAWEGNKVICVCRRIFLLISCFRILFFSIEILSISKMNTINVFLFVLLILCFSSFALEFIRVFFRCVFDWEFQIPACLTKRYNKLFKAKKANGRFGDEFQSAAYFVTLLFNKKFYKTGIKKLSKKISRNFVYVPFYFFALFVFAAFITGINLGYNAVMLAITLCRGFETVVGPNYLLIYYTSMLLITFILLLSVGVLWLLIPTAIVPLVSGFFLNSYHYFPYLTLISVTGFYTWSSWKSLESEYFNLKLQIYKAMQHEKQGAILDDVTLKDNEYIVRVVPKKIYNKIRRKLLPYHSKFFEFWLKVVLIAIFAFSVFKLVKMLQAVDASPAVTVIATLTTGALPYFLNIVMGRISEEKKKSKTQNIKTNVENMVTKLGEKNSARTFLKLEKVPCVDSETKHLETAV